MKKEYSVKDEKFIEREGRLLFLAFIRPIINGIGFDFREVQVSDERRLDVVVTYLNKQYVVELKVWRGIKAHEDGIKQLAGYLENLSLSKGYLLIFDFRNGQSKEWKSEWVKYQDKEILCTWT